MGLAAASAPATKHGRRLREDDGWGTWEHGRGCAACKHGRARRGREGAAKKIGGSAAAGFVEGGGEDEVMEEIWGDREEEDDEPVAVSSYSFCRCHNSSNVALADKSQTWIYGYIGMDTSRAI